jgi:polygalacturonase
MSRNQRVSRIATWMAVAAFSFTTLLPNLLAQDTRTVTEPVIPASCAVLQAQQAIVNGEPSSETLTDTVRIQAAMTACTAGQAVELAISGANNAFITGPLSIPAGVTLLVDGGVTLFGSRNPADYQSPTAGVETCGTVGTAGNGCLPLITAGAANAAIMGYGVIDGRGQDKLLVNGNIASYSWWDQAAAAQNVSGSQNNPIMVQAGAANFVIYKITFRNSAMFHVKWGGNITNKTGFTAWGVKIITPFSARNTDGIDPSGANISILNSSISDGDDNVAVSASSTAQNITVSNVNTYSGHGISIGSITKGGLTNMLVTNINQMGTAADKNAIGLRIKAQQSNGGLVQNVTYQNVCSANNRVGIYLGPYYSTAAGTSYPSFQNIVYRNIHIITEPLLTLQGYQNTAGTVVNPSSVTFDNVIVDTLATKDFTPAPQNLAITLGPGPVSPLLASISGTNIKYTGSVTQPNTAPYPCSAANFQYLVGELYASTAAATSLQSETLQAPTSVTLNAMLQPAMSQVTYTSPSGAGTNTGTPAPTSPVQFMEGTTVVGSGILGGNGTIASATLTGVLPGTHTYTALYQGDSTYTNPLNFGSVTVTVVGVPSQTALKVTGTLVYGSPTSLTATVTGTATTPTGSVQFFDGATSLGTVKLSGGTASLPITPVGGTHNYSANYLGDTTYALSSGSVTAATVITPASTTPSISPSSSAINPGGSTTLTVSVPGATGALVPTGTITVLDGTTTVASGSLVAGTVTLKVTLTTLGTHNLTVQFASSDINYANSSTTLSISVVPQFTLSLTSTSVSLKPNQIATPTLTVTPGGGFGGTVTVTCASPVSYVTCNTAPSSVSVSGSTAATVEVILTVSPVVSMQTAPGTKNLTWLAMLLPMGLLGLATRKRFSARTFTLMALLTLCLGAVFGCGNSSTAKLPPAGAQTVVVTATGGGIAPTASITVNVTN